MSYLVLDHPNALFTHLMNDTEYVDNIIIEYLLENTVQRDERTGTTDTGRTMYDDWFIAVRLTSFPE